MVLIRRLLLLLLTPAQLKLLRVNALVLLLQAILKLLDPNLVLLHLTFYLGLSLVSDFVHRVKEVILQIVP